MGGAFSVCAGGGRGPGGTRPRPPSSCRGKAAGAPPGRGAGRAGGLLLPWAGLLFPLRSCARVAEDGVFYLLYVAFLDTTELTAAIVGLLQWRRCCVLLQFHFVKYNNPV